MARDDEAAHRRRWPLVLGATAVIAVVWGVIAVKNRAATPIDAPTFAGEGGVDFALPEPSEPPPRGSYAGPMEITDEMESPVRISGPDPEFPAPTGGVLEGSLALEGIIDEEGRPIDWRITEPLPGYDQPALEAVRQWRFRPAMLDGRPVSVRYRIVYRFEVPGAEADG